MLAVFVTAVVTWLVLLVLNFLDWGNFLLDGTIAVLAGMACGLLVPWFMVRRARNRR
jgi:hypothetical protein